MYTQSVQLSSPDAVLRVPEFVQLACSFRSRITIRNDHSEFNCKSIMGMMSFNPWDGKLFLSADGDDEQEAVTRLNAFMTEPFDSASPGE